MTYQYTIEDVTQGKISLETFIKSHMNIKEDLRKIAEHQNKYKNDDAFGSQELKDMWNRIETKLEDNKKDICKIDLGNIPDGWDVEQWTKCAKAMFNPNQLIEKRDDMYKFKQSIFYKLYKFFN